MRLLCCYKLTPSGYLCGSPTFMMEGNLDESLTTCQALYGPYSTESSQTAEVVILTEPTLQIRKQKLIKKLNQSSSE